MLIVRKGNVMLREKDDSLKKYYLDSGYDIIDESGAVIEKAVPTDLVTLQAEYRKQVEEIANLKAQIEKLKGEKVSEKPATKKRKTSEE